MRLLADENIPKSVVDALRNGGHDVVWARTDCEGWKDSALLEFAEAQGRIVLTLDKDFLHIALQRRIPLKHGGVIVFRIHPATAEAIKIRVEAVMNSNHEWIGRVSVVDANGIQMFPAR
jgi:predicted nuclease of predicted toxin-antitoxin system